MRDQPSAIEVRRRWKLAKLYRDMEETQRRSEQLLDRLDEKRLKLEAEVRESFKLPRWPTAMFFLDRLGLYLAGLFLIGIAVLVISFAFGKPLLFGGVALGILVGRYWRRIGAALASLIYMSPLPRVWLHSWRHLDRRH